MDSDSDGEDLRELCKLHNAAEAGDEEAIHVLVQETRERADAVAAQLAAAEHTLASPEATAQAYVDHFVNGTEIDGLTPLHLALCNGHFECAKVLIANGADTEKTCEGSYPLHIVSSLAALPTFKDTCMPAVQFLLEHGLSPYTEDDNSRTPLHWAAASDHARLCQSLVAAADREIAAATAAAAAGAAGAAAPGSPDTGGALGMPSRPGPSGSSFNMSHGLSSLDADSPTPNALAQGGAGMGFGGHGDPRVFVPKPLVSLTDDRGNTAVHIAARDACCGAVQELLTAVAAMEQYAQRSAGVATGEASTSRAASAPETPQPHPVLMHRNKAGRTPLHCAVLGGSVACVIALAEAAPEATTVVDRLGATPRQCALKRGCPDELIAALDARSPNEGKEGTESSFDQGGVPANAAVPAPDRKVHQAPVLLVTSPDCLAHHTAKPPLLRGVSIPPENIKRLEVLVDRRTGILRTGRFADCTWAEDCHPVAMTDVLRVHAWKYVKGVREACAAAPEDGGTRNIDSDTAVSRGSFRAALKAAGSICAAVDDVVAGRARRAFCAVRPPGHHSGPYGMVPGRPGMAGSHGFCLLNNIAIGAAYALSTHRHAGIRRVALLDFDVHHGNGTEECVFSTVPHETARHIDTAHSDGVERFQHWRPWFDGDDRRNILFASVQGYGPRSGRGGSDYIYPGSGVTADNAPSAQAHPGDGEHAEADMCVLPPRPPPDVAVAEDIGAEFTAPLALSRAREGPRVINVGIPGPGVKANLWKRSWRDKILPAVVNFAPDLILISAGFDAHRKDDINFNFVGVREHDYAWVTEQIVQVANRVCGGRVVSVLEGGYRVQGQVVSAFARSVAAHVGALAEPNGEVWSDESAEAERDAERREKERRMELKERRAAARAGWGPGVERGQQPGSAAMLGMGNPYGGSERVSVGGDVDMGAGFGDASGLGDVVGSGGLGDVGGTAAAAAAAGAAAALSSQDAAAMEVEGVATGAPGGDVQDDMRAEGAEGASAGAQLEMDSAGGTAGGSEIEEGAPRSKRRRGPAPDYVTLNKQLDQGGGGDHPAGAAPQ